MVATRPILSPSYKGSLAPAKIRRVVVEVSAEPAPAARKAARHSAAKAPRKPS